MDDIYYTVTLSNSVSTTGLDVFEHVGILALCFMGIGNVFTFPVKHIVLACGKVLQHSAQPMQ